MRATFLKTGDLLLDEVWWDTQEICAILAEDKPRSPKVSPDDIKAERWKVFSRREFDESLEEVTQCVPGGSRHVH